MTNINEDLISINFKAFFKVLWKERWVILAISSLFMALGIFYSINARKEYISEGKILPEIGGTSSSSLGGLASLVGIGGFELGLKNTTEAIRPDLYPDVIASTPFFLELFSQNFVNMNGDSVSFEVFYHMSIEENREIDSLELVKYNANPSGIIILNRLFESRIENLRERVVASIDSKSGVISITAKMPDPVIGAQVADFAMEYLTNYVTSYRIEKSQAEVEFLADKLDIAKSDFYKDQSRKAQYSDQFGAGTIRLQSADVNRERIESDYRMSSNLYNELLKKYEEAKLKLQQETPVFKVPTSSSAPTVESEPKKAILILSSLVFGIMCGLIVAILKGQNFKKFI